MLAGERAAHVAQTLLADLLKAPALGIAFAVVGKDVGVCLPIEQARISDCTAQRRAVARNGFGQRVDDQAGLYQAGLEQIRRRDRVVHHVDQAFVCAQFADIGQVRYLRTRIGDGLDEYHARVGPDRGGHVVGLGRIHRGDADAQIRQRAKQAVGVAEHVAAGHQMITGFKQRQKSRGDRRHAGGKAHRTHALLHLSDFGFQRGGRRRALARVVVPTFHRALKYADQVLNPLVAVLNRGMNRLVNAAMFHAKVLVGMNVLSGKSGGLGHDGFNSCR